MVIDALAKALSDEDWRVRQSAVTALGKTKDTKAIQLLTTALRDRNPDVREKAGEVLIHMGAIDRVIKALGNKNKNVRQSAAKALGGSKDKSAVRSLTEAIEDNNSDVREEAARALRHFETAEVKEALRASIITCLRSHWRSPDSSSVCCLTHSVRQRYCFQT